MVIFNIICGKNIALGGCKWFLYYDVVPITMLFIKIFLTSSTSSGRLNNLKGGPYYVLQPNSALYFYLILTFFYREG